MHPAFSVILFTTLIGVAQGLFIALVVMYIYDLAHQTLQLSVAFYSGGRLIVIGLLGVGMLASLFHLGHPERAWRALSQWRTSWLSREVIVLPAFILMVMLSTAGYFFQWSTNILLVLDLIGLVLCFVLFICTAMIYACLSFLREWATPLTLVNFVLLGCASGFSFASFYISWFAIDLMTILGIFAMVLTLLALFSRTWSLIRNAKLKPKATLKSAIGVHHPNIRQVSQGQMGGSYNTREFFHGKSKLFIKQSQRIFMISVFLIPLLLLWIGISNGSVTLVFFAFLIQYLGLLVERWYFFAQVNHPQNLYYQTIS